MAFKVNKTTACDSFYKSIGNSMLLSSLADGLAFGVVNHRTLRT